jgi:hypothetical protein
MDKAIKEIKNTLNQNSFAKTQDKNQQDYINNQNSASNSNYSNSTNATNKNEKLEDYIGYLIVTNDLNTKEWWVEKYNESQLAVNKDNLVAKHQELQKTNPVYNAKDQYHKELIGFNQSSQNQQQKQFVVQQLQTQEPL